MEAHSHALSGHLAVMIIALVIATLGTIHLLTLTYDNRVSRAVVTLGF